MECYNWGAPNADSISGTCPAWSGTSDNGNLYGSVTYAGGPGAQSSLTAYTDTFTYDGLNRLLTAGDSGGWSRTYNYDPYGNMWVTNPTGPGLNSATPTSDVYNSNNQLSTAHYDLSGNQTTIGPYTLNYDAENHQYSESNTIGNPAAGYSYDGAGKRVARLVGAQTTVYVYDAFGALAAAYSNGGMGTPPCHTCYLTYDHLGTTRLITDSNAKVIARHDYLPFGEEIPGGIAGRNASQFGPGLDNINEKFTGQERDSESSLDFFQARYFSGALGRLLSPDPRNAGANLMNPQSWNAYPYGLNNPLRYVDPSGLAPDEMPYVYTPPTTVTASLDSGGDFGGGGGNFPRPPLLGLDPSSGYQNSLAAQDAAKNILRLAFAPPRPQPPPAQKPAPPSDDVVIDKDIFHGQSNLWSNTAGAGNVLAVGTAVVTAAPFVLGGATTVETTSLLAGETPVIGDLADTAAYVGQNGYNVLSLPEAEYGWEAQSTWMGDTLGSGQSYLLASPLPGEAGSMFSIEAGFLQSEGYTQVGSFMVPPVP